MFKVDVKVFLPYEDLAAWHFLFSIVAENRLKSSHCNTHLQIYLTHNKVSPDKMKCPKIRALLPPDRIGVALYIVLHNIACSVCVKQ